MRESSKTICVMGLGYIGLPTASLLATKGFQVLGVDVNPKIVDSLNKGEVLIYEPALDIMVKSAVKSGQLKASMTPEPADIFIIAVPTPFSDGYVPDLSYVQQAARTLSAHLEPGNLVILESTSPVGTTEQVARWIREERPDLIVSDRCISREKRTSQPIFVAYCPERVLPGQILKELVENDRIVGGIDQPSTQLAGAFYREFVAGEVLLTDSRTAELAKLSENAFRDVNIAFANELSMICDKVGINVWELIELANRHPRVNILQPGPGVGGHCIAVDPWFIVHATPELSPLIRTARQVNDSKPRYVVDKIKTKAERFKHPVVACLGLAFKADVDDLRESPAIEIVRRLCAENIGTVLVVEPNIRELPSGLSGVEFLPLETAIEKADIIAVLVKHKPFRTMSNTMLKDKIILDFVNAL